MCRRSSGRLRARAGARRAGREELALGPYAPTYYPGTNDLASAQRVTVAIGQTLSDISIPLTPTPTARLAGTVVDLEGRRAATGVVMVMPRGSFVMGAPSMGTIRPDGTFMVSSVPPGEYVLRAMSGTGPGGLAETPTATVTVGGQDLTGIQLAPVRQVIASGRIVVEGGGAGGQALPPASVQLMFQPVSPEDMLAAGLVQPVAAKDDFSFETRAQPGRMILRVMIANQAWGLKSVRHRGTDVTDRIDISPGSDLSDLEVEITSQLPEVSGLVTNAKGERANNYTVVVFPSDPERWEGHPRYLATGRPDQDGRFRIRTLPPADYVAVALEYVEPGQWMDPDFLESVRHAGVSFSLGQAETRTLDLRLSEPR